LIHAVCVGSEWYVSELHLKPFIFETIEQIKKRLWRINSPCPLNLEGVGAFLFPENIA
jgi:hypothetical protein